MKWIFWLPGIAGGAILLLLVRFFHNGPAEVGLRPLGDLGDEPLQERQRDEAAKMRAKVFIQQASARSPSGTSSVSTTGAAWATTLSRPGGGHCSGSRAFLGSGCRSSGSPAGRRGHRPGGRARRGGALGLPNGLGRGDGPSGLPAADHPLLPRRLGVFTFSQSSLVSARVAKCPHSQLPIASTTATSPRAVSTAGRIWATASVWDWRPCAPESCGT